MTLCWGHSRRHCLLSLLTATYSWGSECGAQAVLKSSTHPHLTHQSTRSTLPSPTVRSDFPPGCHQQALASHQPCPSPQPCQGEASRPAAPQPPWLPAPDVTLLALTCQKLPEVPPRNTTGSGVRLTKTPGSHATDTAP